MRRLLIAVLAVGVHVSALAAEHGVKMVDAAWMRAANANDLEAMMACYADNAVLYPPDSTEAKGKDAIRESFRGMLAAFTIREARIVSATYETRGDISTGWGRFVLTLVPKAGGEPMAMEGRFTEVAQKKGNRWYYIADHASLPLPPPPDASKPAP